MLAYFKTGVSLIVIGLMTIATTYPSTHGLVFFFSTLLSLLLILAGLLQFWIDREIYYNQHKIKQHMPELLSSQE
jgi:hypothetical protein